MRPRARANRDIRSLRKSLQGELIVPDDAGWDESRIGWNAIVDQLPVAVVEAATGSDVVATVRFAGAAGYRVSTQAGGHGAADRLNDCILIRTTGLNAISVAPDATVARLGGGVCWGNLLSALAPYRVAGRLGTNAGISVAGYSLLGGVGLLGRAHGLASNAVVGAEVVLGTGDVVRADDGENADLFWAVRGGGGGFGTVTRLDIKLDAVPHLYGGQILWSFADAPKVFERWRQWTAEAPREVTSMAAVISLPPIPVIPEVLRGKTVLAVTACYIGEREDGERILAPWRESAPCLQDDMRDLSISELGNVRFEPPLRLPARYHSSLLRKAPAELTDSVMRAADPKEGSPFAVIEVRHLGGALSEAGPGQGVMGHVDEPYLIEALGFSFSPERDRAIQDAQGSLDASVEAWRTNAIIPSFAHPIEDAHRVFDAANTRRLIEIKEYYDPRNVMRPTFPSLDP